MDCDSPRCSAIDRVNQCVAFGGVVSNVAVINASIWSSPTTRGRPGRGSSSNAHPIGSGQHDPRPHRQRIALFDRLDHDNNSDRSSSVRTTTGATGLGTHQA
jgi:hypothetical protein